jgi:hypothetical protein
LHYRHRRDRRRSRTASRRCNRGCGASQVRSDPRGSTRGRLVRPASAQYHPGAIGAGDRVKPPTSISGSQHSVSSVSGVRP